MNTIEKRKHCNELIEELQRLQKQVMHEEVMCRHEWGDTISDPIIKKEPTSFKMVGQGSDTWSEPTSYEDVTHPRWKRVCKICGKVEFTTETRATKMAPWFGT